MKDSYSNPYHDVISDVIRIDGVFLLNFTKQCISDFKEKYSVCMYWCFS